MPITTANESYFYTAQEFQETLLLCKQEMRVIELALTSLPFDLADKSPIKFIPGAPYIAALFCGFSKSLLGLSQTIYGLALGFFSIPLSLYQQDAVRQKFAFTLVSHGIGNIGVGLLEAIPVIQDIFFLCVRVPADKMTTTTGEVETYLDSMMRINKANMISVGRYYMAASITDNIANELPYAQKPLLSYVEHLQNDPNDHYGRGFFLLTPKECGKESSAPGTILKNNTPSPGSCWN